MAKDFQHIIPAPHESAAEIFAVYQTTQEYYRELQHRQQLEQYCQWYEAVAQQHQRELQKMRGDLNLLGWFLRGFSRPTPSKPSHYYDRSRGRVLPS